MRDVAVRGARVCRPSYGAPPTYGSRYELELNE